MKMKIEATEANIRQIEKQFEGIIDKLEEIISNLEDEREGDMWRMSAHTPDPEKVNKETENGLRILSEGFKNVRGFVFVDDKATTNE